ncbi:AsmA family protein [Methylobacterium isbiliense]|jgi:AsmA protein|uniref:AsmA domain-containing protein n=1 Tax=Methylobacterium isbiliense TaxID=315478 RepID=A0ABQ4SQH4_9HYPH|nr:AsmA-like C-terminal region-containing protein [Methylobacterium isbiliense]MDN3625246.1 AsmA-like C-terminal region-containing protein [Methylobacterium isbiliense]GJE04014.1 hypothetical protein GMJLKIPL_5974 [Methylobacterium isbiliense]
MSRRSILGLCGASLVVLAAACHSWTVATPAASAFVGSHLAGAYGLAFTAAGPTTLTLLPVPRLSFGGARLLHDGRLLAESRVLDVQLGLGGLLTGRAEAAALTLSDARLVWAEGDDRWTAPLARIAARLGEGVRPLRRLVLDSARVTGPEEGAPDELAGLAVALTWPRPGAALELSGSGTWRGQPASVRLTAAHPLGLAAGGTSPFTAALSWPAGSLELDGTGSWSGHSTGSPAGSWKDGLRLAGEVRGTAALPATLAWLGTAAPLAPLLGRVAFEGRFEAEPGAVAMPALRLDVADARLEGAGAAVMSGGRLALSGTLAAERIDLSALLDVAAAWSRAAPALDAFTRGDLDLRLSAAAARVGPLRAEDVAAGLMIRAGAVEATLGRATVAGGTVKGRAALAAGAAGVDLRVQGTADRIDLGALVADLDLPRWAGGRAQGSLVLDTAGADIAEMGRRLAGRAALTVEGGEVLGLSLAEGAEPQLRRGGRLAFERAQATLGLAGGVGEITAGQVRTASSAATLRGRVFLAERRLAATAEIEPRGGDPLRPAAEARLFEIAGPWTALRTRALSPQRPSPALPTAASAYAP